MTTPPLARNPPRRRWLAAAGLSLAGLTGLSGRSGAVDLEGPGARLCADFEPRAAMWLGHDAGHEGFTAELASALHPYLPLKLLVDEFVRFADPRTVLLAGPDAAEAARHPVARLNLQRMQRNHDILVLLPDCRAHGTPAALQHRVLRVMESAFPGRALQFVDAMAANWVGGGAHCATLGEPRPRV